MKNIFLKFQNSFKAPFAGSPNQNPWNPYPEGFFLKGDDIKSKTDVNKSGNHFSRGKIARRAQTKLKEKSKFFVSKLFP